MQARPGCVLCVLCVMCVHAGPRVGIRDWPERALQSGLRGGSRDAGREGGMPPAGCPLVCRSHCTALHPSNHCKAVRMGPKRAPPALCQTPVCPGQRCARTLAGPLAPPPPPHPHTHTHTTPPHTHTPPTHSHTHTLQPPPPPAVQAARVLCLPGQGHLVLRLRHSHDVQRVQVPLRGGVQRQGEAAAAAAAAAATPAVAAAAAGHQNARPCRHGAAPGRLPCSQQRGRQPPLRLLACSAARKTAWTSTKTARPASTPPSAPNAQQTPSS